MRLDFGHVLAAGIGKWVRANPQSAGAGHSFRCREKEKTAQREYRYAQGRIELSHDFSSLTLHAIRIKGRELGVLCSVASRKGTPIWTRSAPKASLGLLPHLSAASA